MENAVAGSTRRGRLWAVISGATVVLVSAGWVRSHRWIDTVSYRSGEFVDRSRSAMSAWEFHARAWRWHHLQGRVTVSATEYTSVTDDEAELREQWRDWRGWKLEHSQLRDVRVREQDELYFAGALEWRCAGFGMFTSTRQGEDARLAEAPYWFLLLLAASPLLRFLYLGRRNVRRRRAGKCVECGYDLRGSAAAGPARRCPECGTAPD